MVESGNVQTQIRHNGDTPRSVANLEQLDALDETEMIEGYWDGYKGEPEPGNNRSLAYWHGWRNGAVDGKHREGDPEQTELTRLYVARNKALAAVRRDEAARDEPAAKAEPGWPR